MEMIKAYRKSMRERRHCFSMYWDGVGVIQFEKNRSGCSQKIRVRFGKNLKEYSDEFLSLTDLEKRLNSLESFQYIFLLDVSETYMEILRVLNRKSLATNCYEPIITFKDSIIVFPKLKYNDTCFIKYMLKRHAGEYILLWASKVGGCEEYV